MHKQHIPLKQLHTRVFHARENYIPLIITPPCPGMPSIDEFWSDIPGAARKAFEALRPKVDVGSDWIPTLNIGLFQCVLIPSLYGADSVKLDGSEPICRPCFTDLQQALDTPTPALAGPHLENALTAIDRIKGSMPDNFCLSFPGTASPFDLAQLMLGEEFLISIQESPRECLAFLSRLSQLCLDLIELINARIGLKEGEYITNRGLFFPGFRLPCDSIVSFSPGALHDIVLPILDIFAQRLGKLCIHFCTEPAPSGHVLPVLLQSPAVAAVDNWQGPQVFLGPHAPARLQDRIAVISSVDIDSPAKIDTLLGQEAISKVPRKGGRGLVFAADVASVAEGKRIYEYWRSRFY